VRTAAGSFGEAELFQHLVHAAMALQARAALGCELQIFAQRHVGKQRVILEYVTAVALLRNQVHAGRAIEQNIVVEKNSAFVGLDETGNRIEHQGFARAAGAEQDCYASGGGELQIELKAC
jgi:hypothetical protein